MKEPLIVLVCSLVASLAATTEYKYVVHIANIGARYPNKLYKDSSIGVKWNYTALELTSVGMRQLYFLGREMRHRYLNNPVHEQYNQQKINFRSVYSDYSTMASAAYAYAAGLYNPGTGFGLSPFQMKRAIPPTHSVDYKKYQEELGDAALPHYYNSIPIMTLTEKPNYAFEADSLCKSIKVMIEDNLDDNAELQSFLNKEEDELKKKLYPRIKELLQLQHDVTDMEDAMDYRDFIISAMFFSKKLSSEITGADIELLDRLYYAVKYRKHLDDEEVAQVIAYGFLSELKAILNSTLEKQAKDSMTVYMLEDTHILALLRLLNFHKDKKTVVVPFASSLIITVDVSNKVRIFFDNQEVTLNGVNVIELEEFYKWTEKNLLKDFHASCLGKLAHITHGWFIVTFIVGGIFIVILALTWLFILKCRRKYSNESVLSSSDI